MACGLNPSLKWDDVQLEGKKRGMVQSTLRHRSEDTFCGWSNDRSEKALKSKDKFDSPGAVITDSLDTNFMVSGIFN